MTELAILVVPHRTGLADFLITKKNPQKKPQKTKPTALSFLFVFLSLYAWVGKGSLLLK